VFLLAPYVYNLFLRNATRSLIFAPILALRMQSAHSSWTLLALSASESLFKLVAAFGVVVAFGVLLSLPLQVIVDAVFVVGLLRLADGLEPAEEPTS